MHDRSQQGFTLLEVAVSMGIIILITGVVLGIAAETSEFVGVQDADYVVQSEAQRAFARVAEVLRKTGWSSLGPDSYPAVLNLGSELELRLLEDIDGNGFAFDEASGELEWGAAIYTLRLDPATGIFSVDQGPTTLWTLGRNVTGVQFATFLEDNTLALKEVRVTIQTEKTEPDGGTATYTASGSVHMRN